MDLVSFLATRATRNPEGLASVLALGHTRTRPDMSCSHHFLAAVSLDEIRQEDGPDLCVWLSMGWQ